MKHSTLVLLLFVILPHLSFSASADGYLINTNGDTSLVKIYIPIFPTGVLHPLEFQQNPRILERDIPKKMNLAATLEVGFTYRDRSFIFRRIVTNSFENPKLEMKHLIRDGKFQIFRNYTQAAFRRNAISSSYFLVSGEKKYLFPKKHNFRKKVSKFLNAGKDFQKNIRKKKFKLRDLEEMLVYYETNF